MLSAALQQSLFLAGTDTGVGKTWTAVRLLRAQSAHGLRTAGMKPVAAGADSTPEGLRNDDALALQQAASVALPYELVNPCCFARATSPHLAAQTARKSIDIDDILWAYRQIQSRTDVIVVEGAGGWLAPIGAPMSAGAIGPTMQDVALALQLPVVLVVGLKLGCINHALLSAAAIRQSGLLLAGWIANRIDPAFVELEEYVDSLRSRLPEPLLLLPRSVLSG